MTKLLRAIKTAFQYIGRNFGLSFASVIVMTLSFFIVSIVGLAFYGSYKLVQYVDAKPALTLFLRGDLSDAQATQFKNLVDSTKLASKVDVNSIDFSKEEVKRKNPDLALAITDENKSVLPIIAFVYGNSQDDLAKLITVLEKDENFMTNIVDRRNIDKVGWYKFNKDQADVIKDTNKLLRTAGLVITVFLFIISSVLIYITIKLTIHYHRKELEIMDLVGADSWFIKLPFIIDGMVYGITGGLLSLFIIFLLKSFFLESSQGLVPKLNSFFSDIQWPVIDAQLVIGIIAVTCVIGAIVGAMSSFLAILRYVKR